LVMDYNAGYNILYLLSTKSHLHEKLKVRHTLNFDSRLSPYMQAKKKVIT
jgi:hypothetical protein